MRPSSERDVAPQRIHALDAWRATLLLLGVVLHSVSELLSEMPEGTLKVIYLRLNDFIHTFRMPAFFVLSGYFSAMLLETRGAKAFLWNRCQRIVLPFLIFVPLTGLTLSILHIARDHVLLYQKSSLLSAVLAPNYSDGWWLSNLNHLWFLWHLILIIALFSFLWPMMSKIFDLTRVRRAVALSLEHPLGLLGVWGSAAILFGFSYRWDSLPTDTDWVPQHDLILFYFGCFLIGSIVYLSKIDLDSYRKHWRLYVMVGVSCAVARYFDSHHGRTLPWSGYGMRFEGYVVTQALSCVSLTAGSLGLFLHSARHKSAGWRYLSDSSYWVYIVHLPLVFHLTWLCLLVPIPLTAYPVVGLLLTLVVSYASYELMVRTTWLGKLLNGRRYGAFLKSRKGLGAAAGVILGCWGLSASALQDASVAERELGGALHCLPPNLSMTGVLEPGSLSATEDCVPLKKHFICPERRWASAAQCEDYGGVDVVPSQPLEDTSLLEALGDGPPLQYWIGITDHEQEGAWKARDGRILELFAWWGKGEPNDYGGDEDCAELVLSSRTVGFVNDVNCYDSNALLCEYPHGPSVKDPIEGVLTEYRIQASAETLAACKNNYDFVLSRFGHGMVSLVDAGFEGLRIGLDENGVLIGRFGEGALIKPEVSTASSLNRRSFWRGQSCEVSAPAGDVGEVSCGGGRWRLIPQ